jgi:membrane protein
MSAVRRLDRYQRRYVWLGLPIAVVYKFFDDRGPYLAALVTYYAFVSLFPLLLLFFSAAGFFLAGDPGLRRDLERAALQDFPAIGRKLSENVATFRGSGLGLAVGVLGTLYGGLGAMQAAQAGFNRIYGVPRNEQPNPFFSRLRSLALLALLGSGVLVSTGIAIVLSTANSLSRELGPPIHAAGYVLDYGLNGALFSAAFELLTARDLRLREVIRGGMIAAAAWMLLQIFGSSYLAQRLHRSNALYGVFAVVLAALAWLYLQSLILMLAAEINVVRQRGLWPRALLTPFTDNVELTTADRRVYEMYLQTERFKGFERVHVEFSPSAQGSRPGSGAATAARQGAAGGGEIALAESEGAGCGGEIALAESEGAAGGRERPVGKPGHGPEERGHGP